MSRQLRAQPSAGSDDSWGDWGASGIKEEQVVKAEPDEERNVHSRQYEENAQPWEWQDWHPDGGTGSAGWSTDNWYQHLNHSEIWASEEATQDQQNEMEAAEAEVLASIGAPVEPEAKPAAELKDVRANMGKRTANKADAIEEALRLLEGDMLPPNHKSLQTLRRENPGKKLDKEFIRTILTTELQGLVVEHTHVEKLVEHDSADAEMVSFDRMVWLEGGAHNPKNIDAAKKRAKKCVQKGSRYYEIDGYTGRASYAFLVKKFGSSKQNEYNIKTSGEAKPKPTDPKPNDDGGNTPPKAKAKAQGSKERTVLDNAIAKATKVKVSYSTAELQGKRLLESLESDKKFEKEKIVYQKELKDLIASLGVAKQKHPFFHEFLITDANTIKKKSLDPQTLASNFTQFTNALSKPAASVVDKVEEIMRVNGARFIAAPVAKKKRKLE